MNKINLETISSENQNKLKDLLLYRTFQEIIFSGKNEATSAYNDEQIIIKLDNGITLKLKTPNAYNYGMFEIDNFISNTLITDVIFEIGEIKECEDHDSHEQKVKICIMFPLNVSTNIICDISAGEEDYYWGTCVIEVDGFEIIVNHIEKDWTNND